MKTFARDVEFAANLLHRAGAGRSSLSQGTATFEKEKSNRRVRSLGEILDLFERRFCRALLPGRKLGKAMRERIRLQTRALASPSEEFRIDTNSNHGHRGE